MERNRWETAIRCLEIALHPHTTDDEVIAGVNGFRRTAEGTPLSEVCAEFAGRDDARYPGADLAEWSEQVARLNRENLALRRKLEADAAARSTTARRLQDADQRGSDLAEELLAAQHRATTAEQQLAELRAAYARVLDGVNHENFGLRHALQQAKRAAAEPSPEAAQPFQNVLIAARRRMAEAQPASFLRPPAANRARESADAASFAPGPRRPWTA